MPPPSTTAVLFVFDVQVPVSNVSVLGVSEEERLGGGGGTGTLCVASVSNRE